jgi:membrane-bound metal-dependent hydrolase YbcI (DUF457 family)
MFIGHYAVAFAAKKATPKTSLGLLFIAAQFLDLLWPVLVVLGVEQVSIGTSTDPFLRLHFLAYPFSHSLFGALVWGLALGGVVVLFRRDLAEGLIIAGCVLSHWVLDFFTHRPDLPLTFEDRTKVGLGLWNSVPWTMIVETALFAGGIYLYLKATKAKDRVGIYAFWSLIGILFVIYLANIFGPPPTDASQIGVVANAGWVFVLWAWWADRHRVASVRQMGGRRSKQ